jgi:hypothetical protein
MKELEIEITEENYKRAITENSGGCLVADAIKEAYPRFTNVKVDVATVRVTDPEKGERYTYLTPPSVGQTLLFFDQGWPEKSLPKKLRVRNLVRITPITISASSAKATAERKVKRLAELEEKEQGGLSLTSEEKRSLTRLQKPSVVRPTTEGKPIVEGEEPNIVIRGGRERGHEGKKKNPNLLAGRTRHFGAKLAEPGEVFKGAVKEEAEKLAEKLVEERIKEALQAEWEKKQG